MNHLSEDELVELYYGESTSEADAHLRACRVCSAQYAGLKQSLDSIQTEAVPQLSAGYGDRVWESLKPQLIPYQKKAGVWRSWTHWRAAALAISCAIVLAVAFVGGSIATAGGHNPLEPAQFGVPIVVGPNYANFRAITEDLLASQALRVALADDLAATLINLLEDRHAAESMGARARHVFEQQAGATARCVEAIHELLAQSKEREL